ncbi:hypothetical protein QTP70_014684, partial [Hemibagrus guttatus]
MSGARAGENTKFPKNSKKSKPELSSVNQEVGPRPSRKTSCNPTTCPLDPIPSTMLQTISPDLLPFITTVINGSLTSGHVPTAFKKARVIPILKKPALDLSDISNYRPISACLVDISYWMTAHQLKLNPSKTELLVIPGDPSPAQDLALSLNNSKISPSATARNIGVTMDNQLSFSYHVGHRLH